MSERAYVKRLKGGPELALARDRYASGDYSGAVDILERVLKKYPQNAIAYFILGLAFEAINEPHRAVQLFTKSLQIKPNNAEAHYNLGVSLAWLGKFDEARKAYERAIKLDRNVAGAYVNLGNVLMAQGDNDGAIRAYERCAAISTNRPEAIHNRSFVHLLRGNWEEGWRDYEYRWKLPAAYHANPQPPHIPRWTGEPLEGKTILVLHEQGSGDTFMMLRYIPGLLFDGAKPILRVPDGMMRLVALNFPQCRVEEYIHPDNPKPPVPWPEADYVVPFMSLPGIFGTRPDTVPFSEGPYLYAPQEYDPPPERELADITEDAA